MSIASWAARRWDDLLAKSEIEHREKVNANREDLGSIQCHCTYPAKQAAQQSQPVTERGSPRTLEILMSAVN